jgi:hypothetical protein
MCRAAMPNVACLRAMRFLLFSKKFLSFFKKNICGLRTTTYVKTVPQKILQTVLGEEVKKNIPRR